MIQLVLLFSYFTTSKARMDQNVSLAHPVSAIVVIGLFRVTIVCDKHLDDRCAQEIPQMAECSTKWKHCEKLQFAVISEKKSE